MPIVSKAQNAAMHAAAAGNSNIGIPKKVGEEFVEAQAGRPLPKGTPGRLGQYGLAKEGKGDKK